MTIRTFIALELPENELKKIIDIKNNIIANINNIKWEPLNKLHVTLKFLGDTDENIINDLILSLEKLLRNYESFKLGFSNFGMFKRNNKPSILWVGLKENKDLIKLVEEIDDLTYKFGYEKEKRKFFPHITLLRIKEKDEIYIKDFYKLTEMQIPEINFIANKITFFKSILLKSGSVYEVIKNFYI